MQSPSQSPQPDSPREPAISPEYEAYLEAVDRLKRIEAEHDFSPAGEARYRQAQQEAKRAFEHCFGLEQ